MVAELSEGTLFSGRYRVGKRLAAGGMGAVYEAVHVDTERKRALKVMHAHLLQSDEMRDRFKREMRISAQVESEHIVDVSDAGIDEATKMPFMVMELLRGEDLGQRLKRVRRLPPAEALVYLQQTALGLDKTHAAGIVHRDLKPQNLFLTQRSDGTPLVKILDFGIAKILAQGSAVAGATLGLGTPTYMAPEQLRTNIVLTPAADVYALGMVAYTLLVGKAYWSREARGSEDPLALAMAVAQGPIEPATQRAAALGVTLPPGFDAWFAKATAVSPDARFARATEAVAALQAVLTVELDQNLLVEAAPSDDLRVAGLRASIPSVPSVAPPAAAMQEGVTGVPASVTLTSAQRNARPKVLAVAALCLSALASGAWLGARLLSGSPNPAASAPVAAMSAAPPAASAPAREAAKAPLPSATAPAPSATAPPAPSATARATASPVRTPPRTPRPSGTSAPASLLGRD